jgi:hypothetical protein
MAVNGGNFASNLWPQLAANPLPLFVAFGVTLSKRRASVGVVLSREAANCLHSRAHLFQICGVGAAGGVTAGRLAFAFAAGMTTRSSGGGLPGG